MEGELPLSAVLFAVFFIVLFYIYYWAQKSIQRAERRSAFGVSPTPAACRRLLDFGIVSSGPADVDVYNISGRLNGQEHWPTHDGHVSIDSFSIVNEGRKDLTNAPPPYTNVDLPTYDEAIQVMASQKATTVPVPIHNSTTRGPPPEYHQNV